MKKLLILISLTYSITLSAEILPQVTKSHINGKSLKGSPTAYNAFFYGHIYGKPNPSYKGKPTNISTWPAASWVSNLDNLKTADFSVTLGDCAVSMGDVFVNNFKKLTTRLDHPLFIAPGNHDLRTQNPEEIWGPLDYYFMVGKDAYLAINTLNSRTEPFTDSQIINIIDTLNHLENSGIRNLFVLMHKVIWADQRFPNVHRLANGVLHPRISTNFMAYIQPKLKEMAKTHSVYVGSGDLGYTSPSLFLQYDPETRITYFATGLWESQYDACWKINVNYIGKVTFIPIPLAGQTTMQSATTYNDSYWGKFNKVKQ